MQVSIESIKLKNRVRQELGDLGSLAESMKRFGQISPIVISNDKVLIAGGRRLEAARSLGWASIEAVVANVSDELDMLEYEMEENIQRRSFTQQEEEEAGRRMAKLRNPSFFRRIINAIIRFFKRIRTRN
jgi:ParB family chromosome partitioning protein